MRAPMQVPGSRRSMSALVLGLVVIAAIVGIVIYAVGPNGLADRAAADEASAPASAPSSGAYIKFEGIDGEAKDDKHGGWIDILSLSYGITQPSGSLLSGTTRLGVPEFGDIVLVKEIDKSTPKLQEAIATGKHFRIIELELTGTGGGGETINYLKIELEDALVSNYRINAYSASDSRPTETLSLNYGKIKVTYTPQDSSGKIESAVPFEWNVTKGE